MRLSGPFWCRSEGLFGACLGPGALPWGECVAMIVVQSLSHLLHRQVTSTDLNCSELNLQSSVLGNLEKHLNHVFVLMREWLSIDLAVARQQRATVQEQQLGGILEGHVGFTMRCPKLPRSLGGSSPNNGVWSVHHRTMAYS